MLTLKATVDGEPVLISVTDLTAFIHAVPTDDVCVTGNEGSFYVRKNQLQDIRMLGD